jgi:tetratricopeptide (TPR) repeat protein
MMALVLTLALLAATGQGTPLEVPALPPPTREAAPPTDAEMEQLRAGYRLFSEKRYDEAVAAFKAVLDANPHSVGAMLETAMALLAKGDPARALAMSARCAEYRFPELDKCLALVGTILDQAGQPGKAIEAYDRAIAILPEAGTLHYNKAVTQLVSLKDRPAAVATLKRAAVADPRHAATQQMLGRYFLEDDLRTPALLALSRFLILEPATARTRENFKLWYTVFNSNVRPPGPDGKYEIVVNPGKRKDEGDLAQLDMFLGLSQIDAVVIPFETQPGPRLVRQFTSYMNAVAKQEPGADASTFLWTYYIPYFKEMLAKDHVEPFVYHVTQSWGFPGVREWLDGHADRVQAFLAWDKSYAWR